MTIFRDCLWENVIPSRNENNFVLKKFNFLISEKIKLKDKASIELASFFLGDSRVRWR